MNKMIHKYVVNKSKKFKDQQHLPLLLWDKWVDEMAGRLA